MSKVTYAFRRPSVLRDGPLENLWGEGVKYKKNIRVREN